MEGSLTIARADCSVPRVFDFPRSGASLHSLPQVRELVKSQFTVASFDKLLTAQPPAQSFAKNDECLFRGYAPLKPYLLGQARVAVVVRDFPVAELKNLNPQTLEEALHTNSSIVRKFSSTIGVNCKFVMNSNTNTCFIAFSPLFVLCMIVSAGRPS